VGAFPEAMRNLRRTGLGAVLRELTQPLLGICLGMQLLFAGSEEDDAKCLGVIDARVSKLPQSSDLPVPQMGWNQLEVVAESALLAGVERGSFAYFIHSYAAPVGDFTRAVTRYGVPFSAVIEHGNFFGTQFHPERSARLGAQVLANFVKI
jgi:glutamine amidotransferase